MSLKDLSAAIYEKTYQDVDGNRVEAMRVPPAKPVAVSEWLEWGHLGTWLGDWLGLDGKAWRLTKGVGSMIELKAVDPPRLALMGEWIVKHADGRCTVMQDEDFRDRYEAAA